jgi:hypothetical protein
MEDPKLEAMPSEGAVYAKLSSSLFAGLDHTDVAREAKRLVEIITGAAKRGGWPNSDRSISGISA